MPTIKQTRLYAALDRDPLDIAKEVTANLEAYAKPKFPAKPALGLTDGKLIQLYQRYVAGKPLNSSDKATLTMFANWRAKVFQMEVEAAGTVRFLLSVIKNLEDAGYTAIPVRDFIAEQYGRKVPRRLDEGKLLPLCEWLTFQRHLLPRHLRSMDPMDMPAAESLENAFQPTEDD